MPILAGKIAIVTGSGQGVGRGIALALAREGASGKTQAWVDALYQQDMKAASDNDRQVALVFLEEHMRKRN